MPQRVIWFLAGLAARMRVVVGADESEAGYGWLADDGSYGLGGSTETVSVVGRQKVLLAELGAIGDAVASLPGRQLTILSDSRTALATVHRWLAGETSLPPGCRETCWGQPSPVIAARDQIAANRNRLTCRWVRAHCGHPLNEGADALARLASRYARGDSGLTESDYRNRAAGLARGFAEDFTRRYTRSA